jgi:hypothetical protein
MPWMLPVGRPRGTIPKTFSCWYIDVSSDRNFAVDVTKGRDLLNTSDHSMLRDDAE